MAGLGGLLASVCFGVLWEAYDSRTAFIAAAALAALATVSLLYVRPSPGE